MARILCATPHTDHYWVTSGQADREILKRHSHLRMTFIPNFTEIRQLVQKNKLCYIHTHIWPLLTSGQAVNEWWKGTPAPLGWPSYQISSDSGNWLKSYCLKSCVTSVPTEWPVFKRSVEWERHPHLRSDIHTKLHQNRSTGFKVMACIELCHIHTLYIHTYIHTYIYTYIHTYIHTYMYTYIHTYIHTTICNV